MKKSSKLRLSIIFLLIFMTVGYTLLLLAYGGPRWVAFIMFMTIMILKFAIIAEGTTISNLEIDLTYFVFYFLYFFGSEATSNGKTIGKKLLRMSVTNDKGESTSMQKIGLRTLCRFIPFDILSFLWGGNWHDNISGTYVVSDNELKKFKEQHQ